MSDRLASLGRRMRDDMGIFAAAGLAAVSETYRLGLAHLMMVETLQNEARVLGIDVEHVDRIVADVWHEATRRSDGDAAWRERTIRARWHEVKRRAFLGEPLE